MRAIPAHLALLLLAATLLVLPARAQVGIGETAPDFTKQEVTAGGLGAFHSLSDYSDKDVVVLFLFGYG